MSGHRYAQATDVPGDRSRAAIEKILRQHGATAFAYGWSGSHDTIQFSLHQRVIRFTLPRLDEDATKWTPRGRRRRPVSQVKQRDRLERQRWRALWLVIRAKLEAVEAGIALFEQEFLAFVVLPSGQTVGEVVLPRLGDVAFERRLLAEATA